MDLYIDKEFLDNFYIVYEDKTIQKIVKTIFESYGNKEVFMDINVKSQVDLDKLGKVNPFFASICESDKAPVPVKSIKEHLFSKLNFDQTIVFMNKKQDWFQEANEKGALCFSFDNYQEKIKEIIDKLHFKIDLSETFEGWGFLLEFKKIPFNTVTISDGYILKKDKVIEKNLIPILEALFFNKKIKTKVRILTKEVISGYSTDAEIKNRAKNIVENLNSYFAGQHANFFIYKNTHAKFDFHDRAICTNFWLLDSSRGFDLAWTKKSTSQIISETIFDKYTYNRLRRHRAMYDEYIKKLESPDFHSLNFYKHP